MKFKEGDKIWFTGCQCTPNPCNVCIGCRFARAQNLERYFGSVIEERFGNYRIVVDDSESTVTLESKYMHPVNAVKERRTERMVM